MHIMYISILYYIRVHVHTHTHVYVVNQPINQRSILLLQSHTRAKRKSRIPAQTTTEGGQNLRHKVNAAGWGGLRMSRGSTSQHVRY